MRERHFTFEFQAISDKLKHSKVRITDHRKDRTFEVQVSINDRVCLEQVHSPVADLFDLAVAIYVSDRWSKRQSGVTCGIRVRLPMRSEIILNAVEIREHLQQLLYWFTGDNWTFEFTPRFSASRTSELQTTMLGPSNSRVDTEIALWSGGLDVLAGLCNRIDEGCAERFVLVGAGANKSVWGVQRRVFGELNKRLDADMELIRLHIGQSKTKQKGLRANNRLRARGAVFMLLGSAYALLADQNALAVDENGPGALNLPFRASEVGIDHSRGVHPISLDAISHLVAMVMDTPFVIHNPFIGRTKAEMCRVLDKMHVTDIAWETQSCDRPRRNKISQCGTCSSCLLRRVSIAASGLTDKTRYLLEVPTERDNLQRTSHLPHMIHHADNLRRILRGENAWHILAQVHPSLIGDTINRLPQSSGQSRRLLVEEILMVLSRYADEWNHPSVLRMFEPETKDICHVR